MEGPTLRRPWRGWISTVASGAALAVALTLMSMADVGHPSARPERVSTLGPSPTVDHQGRGNAIPPNAKPPRKPADATPAPPVAATRPPTPVTAPRLRARLAASTAPEADLTDGGHGERPTTNPAPADPTSPPPAPPVHLPGDGGGTTGIDTSHHSYGRPHRPCVPDVPHHSGFRGCTNDDRNDSRDRDDNDWRKEHDGSHERGHDWSEGGRRGDW